MRVFTCPACDERVFFDSTFCRCGAEIHYDPERAAMVRDGAPCANRAALGCNWLAVGGPAAPATLCASCVLTTVAPDPQMPENRSLWASSEGAKRWVLASLRRWGWFTQADLGPRPEFRMLAERTREGHVDVIMGHERGVVTLNMAEADAATALERRDQLGERQRTMMGHIRHELGHVLFERLTPLADFQAAFRELFGDERADYAEALRRHYQGGPPLGWAGSHVTPYAAAHPHEDWAESVAHLLHLVEIVDSAAAMKIGREGAGPPAADPYGPMDADDLIDRGADLGIALNHMNRSMGLTDFYPFVLTPVIRAKLAFAHSWLMGAAPRAAGAPQDDAPTDPGAQPRDPAA